MEYSLEKLNAITEKIIGCAIEVHKTIGPGLLESIYEKALCYELAQKSLSYKTQVTIPIIYKGSSLGEHRLDLVVEDAIIVELKAVDKVMPVYEAQLLSYLRLTNMKLGLLINFNMEVLRRGLKRIIL
jgi:GxxExxY protein